MEDMIVQDTDGDVEESEQSTVVKQSSALKQDNIEKTEERMEVEETSKASRKRELKDDSDTTEAKKPCVEQEAKNEDDHKAENNTDAEDSINLDLGDDELLNEEVCFYVFKVNVMLPSVASKISNGYMMEVD